MNFWLVHNIPCIHIHNLLPIIIIQMNKSFSEIESSTFTHRLKTERMNTQTSQFHIASPISSRRLNPNPESSSYMKIAISKTQLSFNRGYLDFKRRQKEKKEVQQRTEKVFQNNKFIVFRNLQEFEVRIQAQQGKIEQKDRIGKSYGIATFKGLQKTINTHQINLHLGEMTVFSLLEGYDGNLAALTLKKKFTQHLLEYFRRKKSSQREQSFQIIQQSINYSIETSQRQLVELQQKAQDSSGTSLINLIIHDGIIYASNCGSSSIFCNTIGGKMIRLANPHTTNNEKQVDRIVRAGGRLYQTIVNVPFKKAINIKGPLRIFPSGLTLTRTIGRSVERSRQKTHHTSTKRPGGITNNPQIQYLPESQVEWIVIVSSKVDEMVKQERMKGIIEQEMAKRSPADENSEVSSHICKRILLEGVENGAGQSLTAIVIIFNIQNREPPTFKRNEQVSHLELQTKIEKNVNNQTLTQKQRSLTYIGKRKNFVEPLQI